MTLAFLNWGHYSGFRPVLDCAKARAGCPIIVISDYDKLKGVESIPIANFPVGNAMLNLFAPHVGQWQAYSLARWYVLRDLLRNRPELFPVFCADWDIMFFRDLAQAYQPFLTNDYNVSVDNGVASAAYGINRIEPLESYCDMTEKLFRDKSGDLSIQNDMIAWLANTSTGKWKVGNLFEIHNGTVLDHNIHCGTDRFIFDGENKLVEFHTGHPYFVLKSDQTRIAAASIHCWGDWKSKPESVLKLIGIKP